MSQFSFGALEAYGKRGEQLPVSWRFRSRHGKLTSDRWRDRSVRARPLPIGYWKGSGLSLMLDMVAALLSGGNAVFKFRRKCPKKRGCHKCSSQCLHQKTIAKHTLDGILAFLRTAATEASGVRYPGERTLETRRQNIEQGIPVDEEYLEPDYRALKCLLDTAWQLVAIFK